MLNLHRSARWLPTLLTALLCIPTTSAEEQHKDAHWGYSGMLGPEYWGELSEEFASCRVGKNQSPIDIRKADIVKADLKPLKLNYEGVYTTEMVNNGHTLLMKVEPGAFMEAEGIRFNLLQFHVHSPSEHRVEGKNYPMELHFVHKSEQGDLAVLGVLFEQWEESPKIIRLEDVAPAAGKSAPVKLLLSELVTQSEVPSYYRYNGSLTTPPCTEGLRWYVWPTTVKVSNEQLQAYVDLIGKDARPTKAVNARFVLFAE